MRLFNQLFRELFASHKILYFNCRRSEDKLSKYLFSYEQQRHMFWTEQNKSFTHIEHHAVTIDLEGFTISLRFLCVIRSPLRFSTARTNITDMFLSIVVTKVEEFGSRMPPQESFPRLNPGSQRLRTFPLTSGRKTSQYAQYGRTGCRIKGAGD